MTLPVFGIFQRDFHLFGSTGEKINYAFLLRYAQFIFFTFGFIEVLDIVEHGTSMNVRHVVVLSELLGVEGLASERLSDNSDLEWLEVTFFAELVLHLLDVGGEARLAEPFEVTSVLSRLVITFSLITSIGGDKEGGWFRLDVHQEEFTPVEIELERSASGMAWLEIGWDVD